MCKKRFGKPARVLMTCGLAMLLLTTYLTPAVYGGNFSRQRLKITGKLKKGTLEALRIQYRSSNRDPRSGRIEGPVVALLKEKNAIRMGTVDVRVTGKTKLGNLRLADLRPGHAIKVIGVLDDTGQFVAQTIEKSDLKGYYKILGHVTQGMQRPDGSVQLKILQQSILIPENVYNRGMSLIRNPDDKRPEQQLTLDIFNRPLIIGGEVGTKSSYRAGAKLREKNDDSRVKLDNEIQLELFYRLSNTSSIFIEGKTFREAVVYDAQDAPEVEQAVERGEMWFYLGNIFHSGFGLQVGRINFRENREWWWDQNLDGVRLFFNRRSLHAELALAEEIMRVSSLEKQLEPEQQGVERIIGRLSYLWYPGQQIDFFFLSHNDRSARFRQGEFLFADSEDELDASLQWMGLRFTGELRLGRAGHLDYWHDAAWVRGHEWRFDFSEFSDGILLVDGRQRTRVAGWAFDSGLSWKSRLPLRPTFTLGYAAGSGDDDPADGTDHNFRQTGLQDNNGKFNGVDRFRYYGEMLRPVLSNLKIFTASVGFELWRSSSIEFLYHNYRQFHASPFLQKAKIKARPNGLNTAIGDEFNIVLGLEEWQHLEIELVAALFRSGAAFGVSEGQTASNLILKFDFNF